MTGAYGILEKVCIVGHSHRRTDVIIYVVSPVVLELSSVIKITVALFAIGSSVDGCTFEI